MGLKMPENKIKRNSVAIPYLDIVYSIRNS